eukprot:PITA_12230
MHLTTSSVSVSPEETVQGGIVHLEASSPAPLAENSSLILAASRMHRHDPLENFKRYGGGWNITNEHYWASVGFTGAPYFAIGGVWFIGSGLVLLVLLCYHCCCKRRVKFDELHEKAYTISLILLVLCTCGGIAGSILLYVGQDKFHRNISHTLDYVVDQSEFTVQSLRNVSGYLDLAKNYGRRPSVLSSMLFLAFLGLLFSILGLKTLVYFLVLGAWFLVAGTFILCGVFVLLNSAVGDACVAMKEWVAHPYEDTALDHILPCVDVATAEQSLNQSKTITSKVVTVVNKVLSIVANSNFPPNTGPLYYNQSGPLVPTLCNPYTGRLDDRQCNAGEVDLTNATQVWENYTCTVSSSGICATTGRISPDIYKQLVLAVNISYGLYHYTPFLVNLQDCTFVRETFSTITEDYCPGLRQWKTVFLIHTAVS